MIRPWITRIEVTTPRKRAIHREKIGMFFIRRKDVTGKNLPSIETLIFEPTFTALILAAESDCIVNTKPI